MNRRSFLGLAALSVFAPKYGRWFRRGSGLIVPRDGLVASTELILAAEPVTRRLSPAELITRLTALQEAYFEPTDFSIGSRFMGQR